MKIVLGAALVATAALFGGAAITTVTSQPASAAVENSRATSTATDLSARRRYRRVVRYAPRYVRHRYVQERYYSEPVYSSRVYSSYGWHSDEHHDWHSGSHYGPHDQLHYDPYNGVHAGQHYGPHSGEHHDWHGDDAHDD